MGDFLPDGLPTFKVVNEVLELTGFNRFELWIAEVFNKLPSITLKKLLLAPRGFLIRKVLVLVKAKNMFCLKICFLFKFSLP